MDGCEGVCGVGISNQSTLNKIQNSVSNFFRIIYNDLICLTDKHTLILGDLGSVDDV